MALPPPLVPSSATSQGRCTSARWNRVLLRGLRSFTSKSLHVLFPPPGTFCSLSSFTCRVCVFRSSAAAWAGTPPAQAGFILTPVFPRSLSPSPSRFCLDRTHIILFPRVWSSWPIVRSPLIWPNKGLCIGLGCGGGGAIFIISGWHQDTHQGHVPHPEDLMAQSTSPLAPPAS